MLKKRRFSAEQWRVLVGDGVHNFNALPLSDQWSLYDRLGIDVKRALVCEHRDLLRGKMEQHKDEPRAIRQEIQELEHELERS